MPPLPTITFAPESSKKRSMKREKRKLAVAVTAPRFRLPSSPTLAAGEQWKLTLLSAFRSTGGAMPSSTIRR